MMSLAKWASLGLLLFWLSSSAAMQLIPFRPHVVGGTAPAYVQGKACLSFSTTALTCTFDSTASTNNLVVFGVSWLSTTITLDSVTGSCVSSPTIVNNPTTLSTIARAAQGYQVIQSGTACTVIFNLSSAAAITGYIHEVSGQNVTTPVVTNEYGINGQENPGTGTDAVVSPTISGSGTNTYIFGWTATFGGNSTSAGTGYAARVTAERGQSEDKSQASSGNVTATFTSGNAVFDYLTGIIIVQP